MANKVSSKHRHSERSSLLLTLCSFLLLSSSPKLSPCIANLWKQTRSPCKEETQYLSLSQTINLSRLQSVLSSPCFSLSLSLSYKQPRRVELHIPSTCRVSTSQTPLQTSTFRDNQCLCLSLYGCLCRCRSFCLCLCLLLDGI